MTFNNAPELAHWTYRRWEKRIYNTHPEWFELEKDELEPGDKPLTESSTGDLVQQVVTSSAFTSIERKVERLAQAQQLQSWLLAVILVILIFRR